MAGTNGIQMGGASMCCGDGAMATGASARVTWAAYIGADYSKRRPAGRDGLKRHVGSEARDMA